MAYMSDLIGKPVADVDGERLGPLRDLVVSVRPDLPHPPVVAIVVKRASGTLLVPIANVAALVAPAIPLSSRLADIVPYQAGESDLFLARDVLDRQIIDTDGIRVVRVNDIEIARVNGQFYVANVDIGTLGLLRRLGLARLAQTVAGRLKRQLRSGAIAWAEVELLPGDASHELGPAMRLRVPSSRMAELHPADLAEIVSDLSRSESRDFLDSLDIETLADTLEEVEPEFQASLVETMPDERVADVLEEMAPDEAADLLAELPEGRSEDILGLMQAAEAKDVRKLLAYPEESAGGIMNTEFMAVSPDLTASQVIALLRQNADQAETIYYVYVTDGTGKLVGVFSLRNLLLADADATVHDFMQDRVVSINAAQSQDDAAQAVAKYNMLAVPVVDDEEHLQGIVTADDALDKIIPTAWKKRLPRLYH
jgi:magnesium transporter